MYNQLRELFAVREDSIVSTRRLRNSVDRRDAYIRIVRGVLRDSSIVVIGRSYYVYDGRGYRVTDKQEIVSAVINILDEFEVSGSDCAGLRDIYLTELQKKVCDWEYGSISFRNGVYNYVTGVFDAFGPGHITEYELDYDWDGSARCDRWISFLGEVLPDESERMVLQEFFGMCFIDRCALSIEKMALMIGSGANGKSVVCDVIKSVLGGNDRVSNLSPDQLQDPKQIVCLVGKILNFAPDVRKGAAFDSSLKALASSQDVTGWKIYDGSKPVKCPPLAFALNELPYFKDTTSAFFRRLLIFGFDYVVPKERQNRYLAAELIRDESSGIFNWIMEGRNRLLYRRGMFTDCVVMDNRLLALTNRVKTEQSPVLQWLDTAGFSAHPLYSGQLPERVSAGVIYDALRGNVSKYNITKELKSYGVATMRGADLSYQLYRISNE